MEVHFNPDSMANILASKDVSSIPDVHISVDSRNERVIIVGYHNHIIKFHKCCDGLYYYDTSNKYTSYINSYSFLGTVKEKKVYFSTSEIQKSGEARKLQQKIGWPITSHFKYIVSKQLLPNFKVI